MWRTRTQILRPAPQGKGAIDSEHPLALYLCIFSSCIYFWRRIRFFAYDAYKIRNFFVLVGQDKLEDELQRFRCFHCRSGYTRLGGGSGNNGWSTTSVQNLATHPATESPNLRSAATNEDAGDDVDAAATVAAASGDAVLAPTTGSSELTESSAAGRSRAPPSVETPLDKLNRAVEKLKEHTWEATETMRNVFAGTEAILDRCSSGNGFVNLPARGVAITETEADGVDSSVLVPTVSRQALTLVTTVGGATGATGGGSKHERQEKETPDTDLNQVSGKIPLLETTVEPGGVVSQDHVNHQKVVEEPIEETLATRSVEVERSGSPTDEAATPPGAIEEDGEGAQRQVAAQRQVTVIGKQGGREEKDVASAMVPAASGAVTVKEVGSARYLVSLYILYRQVESLHQAV